MYAKDAPQGYAAKIKLLEEKLSAVRESSGPDAPARGDHVAAAVPPGAIFSPL